MYRGLGKNYLLGPIWRSQLGSVNMSGTSVGKEHAGSPSGPRSRGNQRVRVSGIQGIQKRRAIERVDFARPERPGSQNV